MVKHTIICALFENLPQFVLQLYESFALGYTFGAFKSFSITLSIILFQRTSSQLLPEILYFTRIKYSDYSARTNLLIKYSIIFSVWLFPYICASMPFLIFFYPDRTQWLHEKGFQGRDFSQSRQETMRIILIFFTSLFVICEFVFTY